MEVGKKEKKHYHKTFGYAEVPLKKPSEYLKKNSRILPPRPKIEEPRCLLSHRRPKIPPHTQPAKKEGHNKDNGRNFRRHNVEQAKKLVPCQPERKYVDTRKGDTHGLQSSGLEPHYVLKETFGKIPSYLHRRQLQLEAEKKERIQAETKQPKPEGRYVTDSERKALLQGLKCNWEQLQKAYMQLPIILDTISKVKRKLKLEEELKQIESDIQILESNRPIFVTDADCNKLSL